MRRLGAALTVVLLLVACAEAPPASSATSPHAVDAPVTSAAAPSASSTPVASAPAPIASAPAPIASAPAPIASAPPPAAVEPPAVAGEPLGSPLTNSPTTSAGDVPDADAVVVALRPKFKKCYVAARGKGPELSGLVSCGVRIAKSGKVAAVSVTRRAYLPYPLVDCIVGELKTAVFKPLPEEAVIQVPVRFVVPGEG